MSQFSPGNTLPKQVYFAKLDPSTGVTSAVTSGSFTGFVSLTKGSAASAADSSLSVAGVYIGGATAYTNTPGPGIAGSWQFLIPGTALTSVLCNSLFTNGTQYFFIVSDGTSIRAVQPIIFQDSAFMVPA